MKNNTIQYIRERIRTLNGIIAISIMVLVLINGWLLFEFLDYLSRATIVGLLVFLTIFFIGLFLGIKVVSATAIRAIENYSATLEVLLKEVKRVGDIPYVDVLLERVLEAATKMVHAEGGAVLVAEDGNLVPKVLHGNRSLGDNDPVIDARAGITGWVFTRGQSVISNDISNDRRYSPEADGLGSEGTPASVLSVAMKVRNETIGVLELVNKKDGRGFSEEDKSLIEIFASQAATGLEKTRFLEDKKNSEIHFTNLLIEAIENVNEKQGHAKRIAKYTLLMAEKLGFPDEQKKLLYRASLLHDIGFIRLNPRKISSHQEYQQHVSIAYDMLNQISLYSDIAPLVLHHHERYDGLGYPDGLRGEDIPVESRMLFVAEAFDAMVSSRSYKNIGKVINQDASFATVKFDEAIEELKKHAGTQFDPELVKIFVDQVSPDDIG